MNEEKKRVRITGTVKFYNQKKGWGFIEPTNKRGDVFFHVSDVEEDKFLKENDQVEFEVEKGLKGPKAVRVRKIN